MALRRLRLQHDLEAALEVEALAQRLVARRARDASSATPTRAARISTDQEEVRAPGRQRRTG